MARDIFGNRETVIENGIVKDYTTKNYGTIDNYGRDMNNEPRFEICGNSIRRFGSTMDVARLDGNMVKCSEFHNPKYGYDDVIGYANNMRDALSLIMKRF